MKQHRLSLIILVVPSRNPVCPCRDKRSSTRIACALCEVWTLLKAERDNGTCKVQVRGHLTHYAHLISRLWSDSMIDRQHPKACLMGPLGAMKQVKQRGAVHAPRDGHKHIIAWRPETLSLNVLQHSPLKRAYSVTHHPTSGLEAAHHRDEPELESCVCTVHMCTR
jgi:hypothetical protein